ncbi:MAG TPA: protealysin inhibitor emfourin [Terriglobales bacterium]
MIERTGGVAGIALRRSISSGSLNPDEQLTVNTLLERSNFFELASSDQPGPPDRFVYTITVETATQSHTVKVSEADLANGLRVLVELVMRAATRPSL